jgi:superfamily II DNA or RNA helicase
MSIRNVKQAEALDAWKSSGRRGTVCLATGFGKTYVGVQALTEYTSKHLKVLIVTPTEPIRDRNWVDEINKWGNPSDLTEHLVHAECINTVYKWTEAQIDEFSLIVIDEVHTTFGEAFSRLYDIAPHHDILGLTATPPRHRKDQMSLMNQEVPVVYEITLQEGVELGVLAPFKLYNLAVPMPPKEMKKYQVFDRMFNEARTNISLWKQEQWVEGNKIRESIFDLAKKYKDKAYQDHVLHEHAIKFWQGMSLRKWACYNNSNKKKVSIELVKMLPKEKWILFTKSQKFCDELAKQLNKKKINALSYHSGMDKKIRENVLDKFSRKNSKYSVLVSVDALNAGFNLPTLGAGISVSGVSTELPNIQQLGRILRQQENKQAVFFNLYSPNTQEEKWVQKKTSSIRELKWITSLEEVEI